MAEHYLDNSATTQVSEQAAKKALEIMRAEYGNPSSLHALGFRAAKELEYAREKVANAIGAKPEEILLYSNKKWSVNK